MNGNDLIGNFIIKIVLTNRSGRRWADYKCNDGWIDYGKRTSDKKFQF